MNELNADELQDVVGGSAPFETGYYAFVIIAYNDLIKSSRKLGPYGSLSAAEEAGKNTCLSSYSTGSKQSSFHVMYFNAETWERKDYPWQIVNKP